MKTKGKKHMTRLLVAALAIVFAVGFTPQMGAPAYASNNDPALVLGSDVLQQNVNTDDAQLLWYGLNKELDAPQCWYVISCNGEGNKVVAEEGVITLLLQAVNEEYRYSNGPGLGTNEYAPSALRAYLDSWLTGENPRINAAEKSAIAPRTLEGGGKNYGDEDYDSNKIRGDSVENAYLWPLTCAVANEVPQSLRTGYMQEGDWWLCSPGSRDGVCSKVTGEGFVEPDAEYTSIINSAFVRPGCNLKMHSVIFTSAAEYGKVSSRIGPNALHRIGANTNEEWKLTVKDPARSGFTASIQSRTATGGTIEYSGASTGENEFLSAVIVNKSGDVTHYGRLKQLGDGDAAGTADINVDKVYNYGDTLYVFNEQCNGDKVTDYSSELVPLQIKEDLTGAKVELSKTAYTYNGKVQKPSIKTIDGKTLTEGTDYTATWSNASSKNAGTYTVTVTGIGTYEGTAKASYKINKAANTLSIKAKKATVNYKTLKNKTLTLGVTKVITFKNKGQGAKTYAKASGSKKITVNKKTGKVTIKKGIKKGTYKVKVKVKAAGTANYKASAVKAVTVVIIVK